MARGTLSSCHSQVNPMRSILLCLTGWVNREHQAVFEFLLEEV